MHRVSAKVHTGTTSDAAGQNQGTSGDSSQCWQA
jgi:hypothetical protein